MNYKKVIIESPLAKLAKKLQADLTLMSLSREKTVLSGFNTVYTISPYRTGTTFIASSYGGKISKHQPFHFLSLRELNRDFDQFFVKRLNTLNLKLECSGFWSAYVDKLAEHPVAKELVYICVLRDPSSWITSAVNYYHRPKDKINFDYPNELFWKAIVGVDMRAFTYMKEDKRQSMIEKLIDYYFKYTKSTLKLRNVIYVHLKDLDRFLHVLDTILDERHNLQASFRRQNKNKSYLYKNEDLDTRYKDLTSSWPNWK